MSTYLNVSITLSTKTYDQLIYHRDPKELQKAIQKMIKEGKEVMPILMFLYKEG